MADGWGIVSTLSDVVAGLGTMGALVVAAGAYRQQVRQHRRLQASAVTCSQEVPEGQPSIGSDMVSVVLNNDSQLPVYFATYWIYSERKKDWIECGYGVDVGPGQRHVFKPYDFKKELDESPGFMGVHFSDTSGNSWLRTNDGILFENTASTLLTKSINERLRPQPAAWQDRWRWRRRFK